MKLKTKKPSAAMVADAFLTQRERTIKNLTFGRSAKILDVQKNELENAKGMAEKAKGGFKLHIPLTEDAEARAIRHHEALHTIYASKTFLKVVKKDRLAGQIGEDVFVHGRFAESKDSNGGTNGDAQLRVVFNDYKTVMTSELAQTTERLKLLKASGASAEDLYEIKRNAKAVAIRSTAFCYEDDVKNLTKEIFDSEKHVFAFSDACAKLNALATERGEKAQRTPNPPYYERVFSKKQEVELFDLVTALLGDSAPPPTETTGSAIPPITPPKLENPKVTYHDLTKLGGRFLATARRVVYSVIADDSGDELDVSDYVDSLTNPDAMPFRDLRRKISRREVGFVLIDASGSMSPTAELLERVILAAPAAKVAYYSGRVGKGEICLVSDGAGKIFDRAKMRSPMGANEVDHEALQFALANDQRRGVIFVTDGGFCGGKAETARIVFTMERAAGRLRQIRSLEDAATELQLKA